MNHILIVEDEPLIRKGLEAMLLEYKAAFDSIRVARNGMQAIEMIEQTLPQIVFTDIRMPKMNGLELCKQLHERYPSIRVVVISGYSDFAYAQECIRYGVKEYVLKPFTPQTIHKLLDQLLAPSKSSLSIAKYEEWLERIVEAIWSLQFPEVEERLAQWNAYCADTAIADADLLPLLNDCLLAIGKRLAAREFHARTQALEAGSRHEIFTRFHRHIVKIMDELSLQRGGQDIMQMAKAYIDENITKNISLEDIAERIGITAPYFSLLFKKINHETFAQYRIIKRMELAKKLLAVPHYRTTDIAYEVGYENYPHFSKTFKKITGQSPQEYRKTMGIK